MLIHLSAAVLIAAALAASAQNPAVELPRHVFIRGESIPVSVKMAAADGAVLEVSLGDERLVSQAFQGGAAQVRLPTADLRAGVYTLKVAVHRGEAVVEASEAVSLVRRPPDDRLEVWLWCFGGGEMGYYFDHGFTVAGGPVSPYWKDADRAAHVRSLDGRLARGVRATICPCGGIARSELKNVDPNLPDVAYLGAGRNADHYFNPFSPEVERGRSENNRRLLEGIGDHPAVKVAFLNTELVDDLWLDNLNREGIELTRRRLGFTREERSAPTFVAPGVIADDDRGYLFHRYVYTEGSGLSYANRKAAEDVKRLRPDLLTLTDPYRSVAYTGMFPGLDWVGTWTYTNNDPKLMLYLETMRAATRDSGQTPLQTVTLLNYPGTLVPRSVTGDGSWGQGDRGGWLLMGPDRCKEVSWIILSRAPRVIGYYFSSACDPERDGAPQDQRRVPHATSDAIKELSDRVFQPYGKMITRLQVARRRIAVLSSQASRLYGKSPRTIGYPNEQIYGFYSVMAMAHLNGDVLFDEHVAQGALKDYDVLAMPCCDVVTKGMYEEIVRFARRGGIVIADQYLGPDVPGAIKLDFDFTYRPKVNADAIESGVMFAEWDDHLNPKTAELAKAKGVTAADDQKIMEAYARRLRETLGERVEPEVSADSPRVLLNVLEKHGVTYLAVINDNRAYDERSGRYQAIMEKLVPQTVALTARSLPGPVYVYDLLERKALPANRKGGAWSFTVNLGELGGKLLALYPVQPARVAIGAPDRASRGQAGALTVSLSDKAGKPLPGLQPLRLTVTDPQGRDTEYSDYHCAERGRLTVPFTPARNDAPGTWRVRVEDLTAGLSAERTFAVK